MAKLWQDKKLDKKIEKFTVGDDYLLDKKLIMFDCKASIAHSKMLNKIGIIKDDEQKKLEKELNNIIKLSKEGKFSITLEDEDCHTAIENHLTEKLGELGKKIHTCRSRNDQVMAAMKLYEKEEMQKVQALAEQLALSLKKLSKDTTPIPGYTHMQKAMPSSVKMWCDGYIESLSDDMKVLANALLVIDKNPLGTGAGYGLPIAVDKEVTKKELGFASNYQSITYVQISRGKHEALILNAMVNLMLTMNKMASDLIMFSMQEFGYFTLPSEFTTGSSIMPQKKNPDILELVRAKYSIVLGYEFQLKTLIGNLISGYNRDLQLTKEPIMKGIDVTKDCLEIMALVISGLKINKNNCQKAMTPDLFATEKSYKLVLKGKSFREAYKEVKKDLNK
ncbi:MAG TPA: argininosuccinate lyase [Candidatus Nanoarchaeia archaeon]|nr:argininosuccinate lyase [Candidatus Nanoarchaeia archaeon]